MKILILKSSSLGDIIHALPVLRLLKSHWPESQIHWWVANGLATLLDNDPDLAGLFLLQRQRWRNPVYWPEAVASARAMRAERFDLAIDLQGLARSALFGWFAGAACTVGLDYSREGAAAAYDLTAPPVPPETHAVERYLTVLRLLQVPIHWRFQWLRDNSDAAAQVRVKWQPGNKPWVLLFPGARGANKRWPVRHFIELCRLLTRRPDLHIAVLGGGADQALGKAITEQIPGRCLDLTGQTSLWEMVEWIRLSRLLITNDTGPMHIAAALKKPVVAIFGPTSPARTGPYGQLHHVLQVTGLPCAPCLQRECYYHDPLACLHRLEPQVVLEKALDVIGAK